ncbi:MAG TPA: tetratricopeptide repeat protein, partial [Polyangiales bacterium]
ALSLSGHTLFVELRAASLTASLELSNELLVSASAKRGDKRWDAWSALVRILGLEDAEVSVSRRAFTSAMNIMEPVDQALEVAAQERLCAAEQIAVEEAEAQPKSAAKAPLPPPPPAAALPVAARPLNASMPAGPTLPVPAHKPAAVPPPPPAAFAAPRPAAAGLKLNRTLMGVMSPSALTPSAASASAVEPKPSLSALATDPRPPAPEPNADTPRYAHRSGASTGAKANMTLLGVAPGSIPGLSELRTQLAQAKPEPEASALADVVIQGKPDNSDFDPPTVKHNVAELPDLRDDELPDLEDLPHSAAPLSAPLPGQRPVRDENDGNNDSFDDTDDQDDQTMVAPSALTRELLEQAVQDALIDRPSLDNFGARPIAATRQGVHSRDPGPLKPNAPVELEGSAEEPEVAEPTEGSPEETLVVKRPPERAPAPEPKSTRLVIGLGVLLGLAALAWFAWQRERDAAQEAAPAAEAPAAAPASVQKPAEPVAPPAEAAKTTAEPAPAAEPAAPAEPGAPAEPQPEPTAPAASTEPAAPAAAPSVPEPVPGTVTPSAPTPATAQPAAPVATAAAPAGEPTTAAPEGAEDPNALLRKGQRLAAQGDGAGARAALEQAMALAADNPHIREALAMTLLKTGDLEGALAQSQAAVKLRPKRARYQVMLGDVLKAQGKPEEAQAAWQKALEIDANDAEAKQRLGVTSAPPAN